MCKRNIVITFKHQGFILNLYHRYILHPIMDLMEVMTQFSSNLSVSIKYVKTPHIFNILSSLYNESM